MTTAAACRRTDRQNHRRALHETSQTLHESEHRPRLVAAVDQVLDLYRGLNRSWRPERCVIRWKGHGGAYRMRRRLELIGYRGPGRHDQDLGIAERGLTQGLIACGLQYTQGMPFCELASTAAPLLRPPPEVLAPDVLAPVGVLVDAFVGPPLGCSR
ncbi:hypothetical protein ABH926_005381 [Catenulispora sp. GP43]|uniref:hypothetical protein n=1 Tax=Catenulispora sp. GP43 TaxID=3156263 RepID=UPI003515365A